MIDLSARLDDEQEAMRLLRVAAQSSSGFGVEARAHLSLEEGDERGYQRLLEEAFALGNPRAAFYLGHLLSERDTAASDRWFQEAARAGITVPGTLDAEPPIGT